MNVRTVCLAILQFSDATGYEIKKMSTEERFAFFVDASFGSIYPALSRLQDDGCVTVREEYESGKPPRKIYSITDKGREELIESLQVLPRPDTFKSEFLLMALCAGLLDRETIVRALDKRIKDLQADMTMFDEAESCIGQGPLGLAWVADYGRTMHEASLKYLLENRGRLEALTQAPDRSNEAAE
ncbi:PadR family transcriptional regulator [Hoeflea sp. TYP-13]|uniref:PadR family transcriptional regulator n=1 Tax=Hoeflea sp. TYP-13 TaxID=3230023 RepID=UPI0034C63D65